MLGATITLGSVATGLVANQFGLAASTSQTGAVVGAQSAGVQVAYVYATVTSSSGCPDFGTVPGGSVLSVTVFDYGTSAFRPALMVVNGTPYFSTSFPTMNPGGMGSYEVTLTPAGSCAHPWGQTVVLSDAGGVEVQFET